jgi:isopenicillin N synthase-like dioxygenase
MSVPELSLRDWTEGDAAARSRFAAALWDALSDLGFVILADHGVSQALLAEAYDLAEAVFALPEADKRASAGGMRGYTPFAVEHAKYSRLADLKEFWQVGRAVPAGTHDPLFPDNVWPADPPRFEAAFSALFAGLEETGRTLLGALAPALGVPPERLFAMVEGGPSLLRVLHYPPVPDDAPAGAVRAAAHEDINLMTLLVAARGAGLELLDREGRWLPVETEPGKLIVDTGDMMARLTNGALPATTHRVVNPSGPNVSRYSMPFFLHPRNETLLAPLPPFADAAPQWPAQTAGEFLALRLREIGLAG